MIATQTEIRAVREYFFKTVFAAEDMQAVMLRILSRPAKHSLSYEEKGMLMTFVCTTVNSQVHALDSESLSVDDVKNISAWAKTFDSIRNADLKPLAASVYIFVDQVVTDLWTGLTEYLARPEFKTKQFQQLPVCLQVISYSESKFRAASLKEIEKGIAALDSVWQVLGAIEKPDDETFAEIKDRWFQTLQMLKLVRAAKILSLKKQPEPKPKPKSAGVFDEEQQALRKRFADMKHEHADLHRRFYQTTHHPKRPWVNGGDNQALMDFFTKLILFTETNLAKEEADEDQVRALTELMATLDEICQDRITLYTGYVCRYVFKDVKEMWAGKVITLPPDALSSAQWSQLERCAELFNKDFEEYKQMDSQSLDDHVGLLRSCKRWMEALDLDKADQNFRANLSLMLDDFLLYRAAKMLDVPV